MEFKVMPRRAYDLFSKKNRKSTLYVISNLLAKGGSGLAQVLAVFFFTKIHSPDESAIIFVLLGYTIWLHVFEFGVSQSIQNKFNSGTWSVSFICRVTLIHYVMMWMICIGLIIFSPIPDMLFPVQEMQENVKGFAAFKFGLGMLIIAVNNVIVQRFLLIVGQGIRANFLMALQSSITICGMFVYSLSGIKSIDISICVYILPQVLVYVPILVRLIPRALKNHGRNSSLSNVLKETAGYWGVNILSSLFLGMDYYYVAHFLSPQNIVSFHFSSRFFFFSYVIYFSFAQYEIRRIGRLDAGNNEIGVSKVVKKATNIGFCSVSLVAGGIFVLGYSGLIDSILGANVFVPEFVLAGGLYFLVRVFRDIRILVLWNLGEKYVLAKLYGLELIVGGALLSLTVGEFGGVAVYVSMSVACLVSSCLVSLYMRQIYSRSVNF